MLLEVYAKLVGEFGHQGWWPLKGRYDYVHKHRKKTPAERFEIGVGAILTQNTSWTNVEKALEALRAKKKLSRKAILSTRSDTLARIIRPAGYHNQKAKKLKEFAKFKGKITRENLLDLWGIGEETADSILLYAYDNPIFVVDAYTKRILSRLGLIKKGSYSEVQKLFHGGLPHDPKIFNEYHALLVALAKKHCKVKPICAGCCLKNICTQGKKGRKV